jgi:hypothetical protein
MMTEETDVRLVLNWTSPIGNNINNNQRHCWLIYQINQALFVKSFVVVIVVVPPYLTFSSKAEPVEISESATKE